jgi:hypothetical protein
MIGEEVILHDMSPKSAYIAPPIPTSDAVAKDEEQLPKKPKKKCSLHYTKTCIGFIAMCASVLLLIFAVLQYHASLQEADEVNTPHEEQFKLRRRKNSTNSTIVPVKVYILLGQSNMLGFGRIDDESDETEIGPEGSLSYAVKEKGLFPYLIDEEGNWTVRNDVRNVQVTGSGLGEMRVIVNDWLTIDTTQSNNRPHIGPEVGIGHSLAEAMDEPVLLLKSCIGNRALGWDLLPPGSEEYEFTDSNNVTWVHPGYGDSPERWKKGTTPEKLSTWYAGIQYDGDISRAKKVLAELDTYYPGATDYEIAGFFWWQGDRDSRSEALSSHYETNLVRLIQQLRTDFNAPRAKFVCASLGQTKKDDVGNEREILDAILTVSNRTEFKGNVAAVYSHPLSMGGTSANHYNDNAETFMNIGEAMGCAMMELQLNNTQQCSQLTSNVTESPSLSPSSSFRPTRSPTIVASSQSSSSKPSISASPSSTSIPTTNVTLSQSSSSQPSILESPSLLPSFRPTHIPTTTNASSQPTSSQPIASESPSRQSFKTTEIPTASN